MSLGGGINSVNLDLLPLTGFSSRMKVGGGERVCTMPGYPLELFRVRFFFSGFNINICS